VPETSSPTATQGQLLAGRYLLTGLIASGGMAQVWLATDQVLERQVAVKILHPHLASDENFVARFRAEAVAAARLRHPSIVSIYDTCGSDGLQAIVMELVRGQNLRQKLNDVGSLGPAAVVNIGAQVADALATAHHSGLVHRDIKPANILLCEDNRVMVTDFGIAKVRGDPDLTQTGLMLGSVKYLSPEQVNGGNVDGRTDIYALAVVLYEALCGRPPFAADSDAATALMRLQNEPLRPRQIKAGIPRGLENVIMRGMAREPDQRFATAEEFRAALLAARLDDSAAVDATQMVAPPRPAAAPPRRRPPARAAAPARRPQPARRPPPRRKRSALVPLLVFVLIALSLATAGALLGRTQAGQDFIDQLTGNDDDPQQQSAPPDEGEPIDALAIASVRAFDPEGDGAIDDENNAQAPLVVDGDPSTTWTTEGYNARNLAPKAGVGLVLGLTGRSSLEQIQIDSDGQGWVAEVYVAEEPHDALGAWGDPVARVENIDGPVAIDLDGAEGSSVLLWITDVGAADDDDRKSRVEISEILLA
jgi:serine/threonine-protein kinase